MFVEYINRESTRFGYDVINPSVELKEVMDYSLSTTLKALLYNRINESENFTFLFGKSSHFDVESLKEGFKKAKKNALYIQAFYEDGFKGFEQLETEGFEINNAVSKYFEKITDIKCFMHKELRTTILLISDTIGLEKWHTLQSALPAMLPWFFDKKKNPVTELELKLCKALTSTDVNNYYDTLDEMSVAYGVDKIHTKVLVEDFCNNYIMSKKTAAETRLKEKTDKIKRLLDDLSALYEEQRECQMKVIGCETVSDEEINVISDFVRLNHNINLISSKRGKLELKVFAYLDNYDEEIANIMINNTNASFYNALECPRDVMKAVLKAIFIKKIAKLRTAAAYSVNFFECDVDGIKNYSFASLKRFPNTHINQYACLGSYKPMIIQCLGSNDIIGALNLIANSASSFNFADEPVLKAFTADLSKSNYPCIEYKDNILTFAEFAQKIMEENKDE